MTSASAIIIASGLNARADARQAAEPTLTESQRRVADLLGAAEEDERLAAKWDTPADEAALLHRSAIANRTRAAELEAETSP